MIRNFRMLNLPVLLIVSKETNRLRKGVDNHTFILHAIHETSFLFLYRKYIKYIHLITIYKKSSNNSSDIFKYFLNNNSYIIYIYINNS